jgi:hypothetical protein
MVAYALFVLALLHSIDAAATLRGGPVLTTALALATAITVHQAPIALRSRIRRWRSSCSRCPSSMSSGSPRSQRPLRSTHLRHRGDALFIIFDSPA